MHPQLDLTDRQEAFLLGQERMLLIGVDDLAGPGRRLAMRRWLARGQGQIHQVVIVVDPHMQDGLEFHVLGLGIIGLNFLSWPDRPNRLLTLRGRYLSSGAKATSLI